MRKGAVFAGLVTAIMLIGSSAHSAEDRNQPKCTFHIFTDVNDHWALTEGSKKRKWLVMNVGEEPALVTSSENTTLPYPEHTEVVGSNRSTIVAMKYGQPTISLAPTGKKSMIVVCRFFERGR
jgi:hypothetical protein